MIPGGGCTDGNLLSADVDFRGVVGETHHGEMRPSGPDVIRELPMMVIGKRAALSIIMGVQQELAQCGVIPKLSQAGGLDDHHVIRRCGVNGHPGGDRKIVVAAEFPPRGQIRMAGPRMVFEMVVGRGILRFVFEFD